MSKNLYLEGINIKPKYASEAKLLIGKKVRYVRVWDVDNRRGTYLPRENFVLHVVGRQIVWESGDSTFFRDILEMVEA